MTRPAQAAPIPPTTGGDDLDDGLELDPSLLASDDEDGGSFAGDEDADAFMSDDDDQAAPAPRAAKRKASDDEPHQGGSGSALDEAAKKKLRREKDKARKAARRERAAANEEPAAEPTLLTRDELAGMLLASARAAFPSGSAMEIDDVAVAPERILAPPDTLPDSDGDAFAPLVARLTDVLKDAPKKPAAGTPRAIIVSLSGIRCADVVRVVRHIPRPGGEVAKLFAKHFKLADQAKYLSHSRVAVAVGTPARLAKLLADGALKVSNQTVVLLDVGHRDSKNRSLLTLPEVRDELWKGLLSGAAREALKPVRYTAF